MRIDSKHSLNSKYIILIHLSLEKNRVLCAVSQQTLQRHNVILIYDSVDILKDTFPCPDSGDGNEVHVLVLGLLAHPHALVSLLAVCLLHWGFWKCSLEFPLHLCNFLLTDILIFCLNCIFSHSYSLLISLLIILWVHYNLSKAYLFKASDFKFFLIKMLLTYLT